MVIGLQALVARVGVNPFEPVIGSIACVALPTVVRLALSGPLGAALPFATYFPAVLLATLCWGFRWGAVVLAASGLTASALFVEPNGPALYDPKWLAVLALFLICGALLLMTGHSLRQALIRLDAARKADAARKSELLHRMKNSLAIVQSFSGYLSQKTTDVNQFHQRLEAKIIALATASEVLFAERYDSCALPEIALAALAPFANDDRLSSDGPPVDLDPDCAEPLVLALHELATNAHKYGSLSVVTGKVELSWHIARTDKSKCVIRWVEKNGPLVHPPVRAGLGQLLLTPQRGLGSVRLDYAPSGLICELSVSRIYGAG